MMAIMDFRLPLMTRGTWQIVDPFYVNWCDQNLVKKCRRSICKRKLYYKQDV